MEDLVLHHLINNTENLEFRNFSKLVHKYENENNNVLAHFHLMAIQKVYEQMIRKDLVQEPNEIYAYIVFPNCSRLLYPTL